MKSHIRAIIHLGNTDTAYDRWVETRHTWTPADCYHGSLVHQAIRPLYGIVEIPR